MSDALVRADQAAFLGRLKEHTEPYHVEVEGVDLSVLPGVFPPTTDTRLLARHINTKAGDRVLDLTCGAGAFSVIAGLQGASGVANDLNPLAAKNARKNILHYAINFTVTEGNLYENVPTDTFDYIFSNGPYIEGVVHDPLELAFFGARKYVTELFKGARERLARNGKMLVTFAEFGDLAFFENTASQYGLTHSRIDVAASSDGQRVYHLYELN